MDAHIRHVLERVQIPEPPRKPKRDGDERGPRFELDESDGPPPDVIEPMPRRDLDLPVGHATHDETGVRVDVTA